MVLIHAHSIYAQKVSLTFSYWLCRNIIDGTVVKEVRAMHMRDMAMLSGFGAVY